MGKKNLIKSTTKTKKVKPASEKKKAVRKTVNAKATTPKKKVAQTVSQKSEIKKKAVTKAAAKKITSSIPKKISVKDLIFKKFDRWQPDKLYVIDREAQFLQNYQATPFFAENTEEAKRIKKLLFLQFDLEVIRKQAAEKAAVEKAAKEKIAAQKIAAEKAAEEKVAAEKVAIEKAAAEKIVSENATGKKEISKEITINVTEKSEHKYLTKEIISITACAGFIFLLLIFSSISNIKNYYIKSTSAGIEILKGDFAPMGNSRLITLMDWQSPDLIKPVYTKEEIFSIIMDRVEELLNSAGTSDPEKIKLYIIKALPLASNKDARKVAYKYIDTINLQIEKNILGTENK